MLAAVYTALVHAGFFAVVDDAVLFPADTRIPRTVATVGLTRRPLRRSSSTRLLLGLFAV